MKKIHLILALIVCIFTNLMQAQAPQKMSYQAVIRNTSNVLVTSTTVGMRISILQGSSTGSSVYTETQTLVTNANGLVSLEIGTGTVVLGTFSTINWATGPYFIKTETDPTGGSSYTIFGTTQLTSVPYALFSATSGSGETPGTAVGDMKYWNGTSWVMIPVGTPGQFLQLNSSSIPGWTGGTFPTLTTVTNPAQTYFDPNPAGIWGNVTSLGITNSGGSPISSHGVCWGLTTNPTVGGTYTLFPYGTGLGNFYANLTNLLPATTYHVRAFVINSTGVTYGNDITYTTFSPTLPTLTTAPATAITGGTASVSATISNDGGAAITERGICWSTSPSPTVANDKSSNGIGIGTFSGVATGLLINTTYYVRSYATSVAGTSYGNEISFTTTSTLSIGSFYQGGIIGYFLQPGDPGYSPTIQHGIIISKNAIGTVVLACNYSSMSPTYGTTIGSGITNTTYMDSICNTAGTAVNICENLVLNSYSDWFIGSTGDWTAVDTNHTLLPYVGNYLTSNPYGPNSTGLYIYYPGSAGNYAATSSDNSFIPFVAFRMF